MTPRTIASALTAVTLALTATSCGDDEGTADDRLVIGVSGTSPGLAEMASDGTFSGFDIDLATYVAKGLGWNPRKVTFEVVDDGAREQVLANGSVDLVLSSYEITEAREEKVDFAGPYFTAGQDLLVAEDSRVTGPGSLNGKTVCGVRDTDTLERITAPDHSPEAAVQEADDLATCVAQLLYGAVDAVTADDVALAGYAQEQPDKLRVVGSPFTTAAYGIGLPDGSGDVGAVDGLLQQAIDDGSWQRYFEEHFGASGFAAPQPPTPGG